jgi:hypothetical protein
MLMESGMMASICRIRRKDTDYTTGLMDVSTRDGGLKGSSTDMAHILIQLSPH